MVGTIVNVGGILLGSLIGVLLKKGIPDHINSGIIKAQGVAILIIGLNGVLTSMLYVDALTGKIKDNGALLLLISLVIGCLIGELLRIDDHLIGLSHRIEKKFGASDLARGFVAASLVFVIGAMGIVGALNDGLTGDSNVLFTKTVLDFITSIVLTASLGIGVIFAAIPVLLVQGAVSLLAGIIAPYVSDDLISMFSMVGYSLVLVIGFNFLTGSKVKAANLLPALLVPIGWYFISLA